MNDFADFSLSLAWFLALVGCVTGAWAGYKKNDRLFSISAQSTICVCVCTGISIAILAALFAMNDYRNDYVWKYSNRAMDPFYKVSAIWGGMDGSMLLWCFMLSVSSALVAFRAAVLPRKLMPWVLSVINSSTLFFLTIVVFFTNPFRYIVSPVIPPDGNGLNPLLQNPYMAIHPPMLYLGFTTFAIPYAFCMGALLSNSLDNEWIRLTRRWTIIAWCFLTTGIVLGGHWAYIELGWGGFWAWDPVENASFLPWLTGTAFLHSVMVQERKNMLKFWNVWLIVATYGLTVFGTFLTRSGVVQSVHAFAETKIGHVFLQYLAALVLLAVVLTIVRRFELRSERRIESLISREAFFLFNNLVLLSICFATLWGVMFPVLSEAITGSKQTVSIPFFNAVNVPLFLLLLFLMGVGPLIAWRKASISNLARSFSVPAVLALLFTAALVAAGVTELNPDNVYPLFAFALSFFVLGTIMGELHRGYRAQRESVPEGTVESVKRLFARHRTRYGGHLVHFGVVICAVSITASMAFKTEREFTLAQGESYNIGTYRLTLSALAESQTKNYYALQAVTQVHSAKDGALLGELRPEMRRYFKNDEPTTEVALRSSPRDDLYLVIAGLDEKGTRAAMKVFVNPLQMWLWVGSLIMVFGGIVVVLPHRAAARSTVAEPLAAGAPAQ